eukprot:5390417-Amphidinium_carterae.1
MLGFIPFRQRAGRRTYPAPSQKKGLMADMVGKMHGLKGARSRLPKVKRKCERWISTTLPYKGYVRNERHLFGCSDLVSEQLTASTRRRRASSRRAMGGKGHPWLCFRRSGTYPDPEKHEGRCRVRAYPCCSASLHCSTEGCLVLLGVSLALLGRTPVRISCPGS